MRLKLLLLALSLIFGVALLPTTIKAQIVQESTSILMDVIPANPAPNENVSLTLKSYAENLDGANISWLVDGKNVSSGVGKKSISVQAPALGKEMTIVAKITLSDNQTQISTIIRPAEMILLWQADDSHVPPFYKGKALPSPDSFVKVVAMPEIRSAGKLIDSKNLVYSWQKDYNNMPDGSGYGKNFFLFKNDYLGNSNIIGTTASTSDLKYSSASTVSIGMFSPEMSFYKNDENLGTLWDVALNNNHRIQGSEVVLAVPYFISPKDIRNPDLVFKWSINNAPVSVASYAKNLMPLQIEAGTSGTSKLRLEIDSTDKIFQTASKEINIQF